MVRPIIGVVVSTVLACMSTASLAVDYGPEIDLTGLSEMKNESSTSDERLPLKEVAAQFGTAPRTLYVSGMIGPSFANTTSSEDPTISGNDSLFNAGGALGIAFARENGRLRVETEGMGRSNYTASCADPSPCSTVLTNNWSVMENVWRDVMLTDRFGAYAGGGIGAGGYTLGDRVGAVTLYDPPAANFAWQFGGGLLWEITDRLTFDVGYRYFQIDAIQHPALPSSLFAANELMFTLRLYEPFRRWSR